MGKVPIGFFYRLVRQQTSLTRTEICLGWKQEVGDHRRSLVETAIYRVKMLFGASLQARLFAQQVTDLFIKVAALNRMTHLGMPESSPLAAEAQDLQKRHATLGFVQQRHIL